MTGAGPDWEAMREYAAFLRIPDTCVKFIGMKEGKEFEELLCNADFSVLSSRYETFGTVVVESLSCGVPVVATRVGVAADVINVMNGLLVPPDDEQAMTDAMFQMLGLCREYDKVAIRDSVAVTFSKETVGQQIVTLYKELLKNT